MDDEKPHRVDSGWNSKYQGIGEKVEPPTSSMVGRMGRCPFGDRSSRVACLDLLAARLAIEGVTVTDFPKEQDQTEISR